MTVVRDTIVSAGAVSRSTNYSGTTPPGQGGLLDIRRQRAYKSGRREIQNIRKKVAALSKSGAKHNEKKTKRKNKGN